MSENIKVKLPDGSVKDVPRGTTALEIAKGISPRLADAALAAKVAPMTDNGDHAVGTLVDLTRPLESDTELRLLTDRDPEALEVYRHSSAHLLAAAVLDLFPETKLGHGPSTESRSEERRVGKACRYWRDWSSDVCSSDLGGAGGVSAFVGPLAGGGGARSVSGDQAGAWTFYREWFFLRLLSPDAIHSGRLAEDRKAHAGASEGRCGLRAGVSATRGRAGALQDRRRLHEVPFHRAIHPA